MTEDERRAAFQTRLENLINEFGITVQPVIQLDQNIDSTVKVFVEMLTNTGRISPRFNFAAIAGWQPPKPPDPLTKPSVPENAAPNVSAAQKSSKKWHDPIPADSFEMDEWRARHGELTAVPLGKDGRPAQADNSDK